MRTRPDHWYRQSAAVPVREKDGGFEVMLVTSLKNSKWILPKGIVEPGMTPQDSAAKEAWEEAGVKGVICEDSLGHFQNQKWGGICRVDAYRLDVTEVAEDWLESGKRKRKWFTVKEALKAMKDDEAAAIVRRLGELKRRLILVRHAKASRDDPGLADFDRPLAPRGKRDAPEMGKRLKEAGIVPDLIVTSPAKRALRTAKLLVEAMGLAKVPLVEAAEIYEAEVTELTALIRELDQKALRVMLVGHNPGLSDLMRTMIPDQLPDLPTCGVVCFEVEAPDWLSMLPLSGKLLYHDYPKKERILAEGEGEK